MFEIFIMLLLCCSVACQIFVLKYIDLIHGILKSQLKE